MASLFSISFGDAQEFMRILAAGGFDSEAVEYLKKHPELAKELRNMVHATEEDIFAQYNQYLWSQTKQLEELRRLNKLLPENIRLSDLCFNRFDSESNHIQSVRDYEFPCPIPEGGLQVVFDYLCSLLRLIFPNNSKFQDDPYNCSLEHDLKQGIWLDSTAYSFVYNHPGIHWLSIDFTTGWIEPSKRDRHTSDNIATSVQLEREKAKKGDYNSAGLLSLAARALMDKRAVDCKSMLFSYCVLSDIGCGENGEKTPYIAIVKDEIRSEKTLFVNTLDNKATSPYYCYPSITKH